MAIGRSSSVYSAYSSVRSMPRISPSELTISVTTRPQPPCRFTRRRKAESVMPAIGAMANGEDSGTPPIFMIGSCVISRRRATRIARAASTGRDQLVAFVRGPARKIEGFEIQVSSPGWSGREDRFADARLAGSTLPNGFADGYRRPDSPAALGAPVGRRRRDLLIERFPGPP